MDKGRPETEAERALWLLACCFRSELVDKEAVGVKVLTVFERKVLGTLTFLRAGRVRAVLTLKKLAYDTVDIKDYDTTLLTEVIDHMLTGIDGLRVFATMPLASVRVYSYTQLEERDINADGIKECRRVVETLLKVGGKWVDKEQNKQKDKKKGKA